MHYEAMVVLLELSLNDPCGIRELDEARSYLVRVTVR
jgi:hypothetical protein